jgi:hypothetical protein
MHRVKLVFDLNAFSKELSSLFVGQFDELSCEKRLPALDQSMMMVVLHIRKKFAPTPIYTGQRGGIFQGSEEIFGEPRENVLLDGG